MPVISGNGNDVIRINGKNVQYQGIGHVRKDMALHTAVATTKDNGLDEYYVNVQDEQGRTQRIVVYGDHLDFSFRKTNKEPIIEINGRQGKIVGFEDERTTFAEGIVEGAKASLGEAFATLSQLAKTTLGNIVGAGALTMAGGATLLAIAKPLGFVSKGFGAVLAGMAQPLGIGALAVAVGSLLLIALAGAIRGGSAALTNHARMETIATVSGEANQLNAQHPYDPGAEAPKDVPVVPQQPQRPTPPPVGKPQAWAPTPPVSEPVVSQRPVLQRTTPPANSAQATLEFRKLRS